ncbi:MAG TPA: hypothetical protein VHO24_18730 [Opitutaceae bacterium]|nr:hypothetical protein [Opitutaceae bacterium]
MARLETSGRFAGSLAAADFILCILVALIYGGCGLNRAIPLQASSALPLALALIAFHLAACNYAHLWPSPARWRILRLVAANGIAALILPATAHLLQIDLDRRSIAMVLLLFTPLQLLLHLAHARRRSDAPLEPLRWTLAAAGAVAVGFPFLTANLVGTGDAYWYANMVADFATQWRAGVFPVFVGQSDFAFNGAVSPLRFAPYLQHAAGVLDLLTLRTLSFAGLVNLTLFTSFLAGALTTYASLVAIARDTRWLALLFALLFISSPSVLSLAYTGDLFMSVCTLPYLPLVLLALHRTFTRRDLPSLCGLAAALAMIWLAHPPIAFWITLVAVFGQLFRLVREWRDVTAWKGWLAAGVLFGALTLGTFVSVWTLHIPVAAVERSLIIDALKQAYPGALLPVSDGATALSDYQLGASLWTVFIFGGVVALIRRRPFELALLGGALLFTFLLLPIPHVLEPLWNALPQAVCNLTFYWPMQRLYVVLATLVIFAGYAGASDLVARRWWLRGLSAGALLIALQWSAEQAGPFLQRGVLNRRSDATMLANGLPQNRILTRYAYSPFPTYPPYFAHGYVDPVWENRLLEPDSWRELDANSRAVSGATSVVRASGPILATQQGEGSKFHELVADLPLEPNRHYALTFEFRHPLLRGSLLVSGPTLAREYYLPDSSVGTAITGPTTSFGTLPNSRKSIPLLSSSPALEKLTIHFVSETAVAEDIRDFGRFTLSEYDPARLPVAVESWVPYRAKVTSPARAWLETPRIFIAGYAATVNGKSVPVSRSPGGLVMFPVGAGENRVQLRYPGPLSLRASYFASLFVWLGLGVFAWRRRRGPATA